MARGSRAASTVVDLAGKDDYLGVMGDGKVWRQSDVGVGVDRTAPEGEGPAGGGSAPGEVHGTAEIPAICSYEGELTQEVFDELWEIAVRWEVGDNRYIVPAARKRLVAFGAAILPLLDAKVETDNSGLELRAFVAVLRGLPREPVLDFLRRNVTAESERRRQVALHLIGELKATEVGDAVAALLDGANEGLARRAAGVLGALGSHEGDATLVRWLATGDGRKTAAAVSALLALEADVYPALRPLLASEDFAVRGRVVTLLAAHLPRYADAVRADLAAPDLGVRARRSVLDILARGEWTPAAADAAALATLVGHEDWGVRGDAARVIRRLESQEAMRPAVEALERRLATETEPYVKSAAEE